MFQKLPVLNQNIIGGSRGIWNISKSNHVLSTSHHRKILRENLQRDIPPYCAHFEFLCPLTSKQLFLTSKRGQASSRNFNLFRSRRGKTDTYIEIKIDIATRFFITSEDEGHPFFKTYFPLGKNIFNFKLHRAAIIFYLYLMPNSENYSYLQHQVDSPCQRYIKA